VLPVEINLQAQRVMQQDALSTVEYSELMMDTLDEVLESQLKVLREIEKEKLQVAKAYNRRVKDKSF
jgi:hypothetical protein